MRWKHVREGDLDAVQISDFGITATVVPQLGAKIASIVWQDEEILFQNPIKPLRAARYGASYEEFDASGFDECLPSIGPCTYPTDPWSGVLIPDHGELWSIPWSVKCTSSSILCSVHGIRFPFRFHRTVELRPNPGLRLKYRIDNLSSNPFSFLWSAHPLLRIRAGMRIHLPDGVSVFVDWSKDERLGKPFNTLSWPVAADPQGNQVDLSIIANTESGTVDKLFTTRLQEGWCGLHNPVTGQWVAMAFRVEQIPFVGLSINLGGWPVGGPGYVNLGLEPCLGFPDRLDLAVDHASFATVRPGGSLTWQFDMLVGRDADFPKDRLRESAREANAA